MKKLLIFTLFFGLQTAAMAQETTGLDKDKAVYLELLGASNLVGINYDARFNDHTRFGWRAGLSSVMVIIPIYSGKVQTYVAMLFH